MCASVHQVTWYIFRPAGLKNNEGLRLLHYNTQYHDLHKEWQQQPDDDKTCKSVCLPFLFLCYSWLWITQVPPAVVTLAAVEIHCILQLNPYKITWRSTECQDLLYHRKHWEISKHWTVLQHAPRYMIVCFSCAVSTQEVQVEQHVSGVTADSVLHLSLLLMLSGGGVAVICILPMAKTQYTVTVVTCVKWKNLDFQVSQVVITWHEWTSV